MFCSFYLILYMIWFQFSLSLSPFFYFDYYEHQYFTSFLFHMFFFIKNALFGSYSWMSHRTFIESSAVTTAFWLDQYGGRFASIFRRCPPSMFWGQCDCGVIAFAIKLIHLHLECGELRWAAVESNRYIDNATQCNGSMKWPLVSFCIVRGSTSCVYLIMHTI